MQAVGARSIYAVAKRAGLSPSTVFSLYQDNRHKSLCNILALLRSLGFELHSAEFKFLEEMVTYAGAKLTGTTGDSDYTSSTDDDVEVPSIERYPEELAEFADRCFTLISLANETNSKIIEAFDSEPKGSLADQVQVSKGLTRELQRARNELIEILIERGANKRALAEKLGISQERIRQVVLKQRLSGAQQPGVKVPEPTCFCKVKVETLPLLISVRKALKTAGYQTIADILAVTPGRVRRSARLSPAKMTALIQYIQSEHKPDWELSASGDTLICDSRMPGAVKTQLRASGFRTLHEVVSAGPEAILARRGIGRKLFADLKDYLNRHVDPTWGAS